MDFTVYVYRFSSFEVEAHPSCGYDYVEVRDGDSLSSPLMGRFCGRSVPDLLRSTGNSMVVNFVTDPTVVQGGFSAGYWTAYGKDQQHSLDYIIRILMIFNPPPNNFGNLKLVKKNKPNNYFLFIN